MTSIKLINKLSDGLFHSGSELGDLLGISRAAVWKQIQKLEVEFGIKSESVKGKGYRIKGGLDLIDKSVVLSSLDKRTQNTLSELDIRLVVDSTNDIALEKAKAGVDSGYVCIAEKQNSGRGRRGRNWVSPFGKNIYLSILWRFHGGATSLEGLSLAAGVAVVKALSRIGIVGVNLKWPNDVLYAENKLAGILLEMSGDVSGVCEVVLGLGLNIQMTIEEGDAISQNWVDLRSLTNDALNRNEVIVSVLEELFLMLEEFSANGFSGFAEDWARFDAYRGRAVSVTTVKGSEHGISHGVDHSGALQLEIGGHIRRFSGGEVSLRLKK